jgi:hypothetical protein
VERLIQSGFIGKLRQVVGFNANASFADPSTPLSGGRNDLALYGKFNAMQLGLSYDVMRRWTGNATSVVAQRAVFVPRRPLTPNGPIVDNPYPDAVTVLAETTSGASAINMLNYAVYHGESRISKQPTTPRRRDGASHFHDLRADPLLLRLHARRERSYIYCEAHRVVACMIGVQVVPWQLRELAVR